MSGDRVHPIAGYLYSGLGDGGTEGETSSSLSLLSLNTGILGATTWRAMVLTPSLTLLSTQRLELGCMTGEASCSLPLAIQHRQHWSGGMSGDRVHPIPGYLYSGLGDGGTEGKTSSSLSPLSLNTGIFGATTWRATVRTPSLAL